MSYRISFDELPWEDCGEGVRQKAHREDGQLLRLVEFRKKMPHHWCERGHVGRILTGTLDLEFPSGNLTFGPGDGVLIPSGFAHRHRGRVRTDVVTALFVEADPDATP